MTKYDVYVPLKHNDGTEIEDVKINQIGDELVAMFGAVTVSALAAPYQGKWKYGGVEYVDDIIKMEVITEGDDRTEQVFTDFKEHVKELLQQI